MKINIIGGGPGGLYSAILLKLQQPDADISVFERNGEDSTFGFGIVLSKETLAKLDAADPASGATIRSSFAYWDDLYVQHNGASIRSEGHGYSGLERLTLLRILAARARELGVNCHWNTDVSEIATLRNADLVIASDGVNSAIRGTYADVFKPSVDVRKNRFVWLGTDKPLPGFVFMFRENQHGIWIVHAYEYKAGHSTFVVETTNDAWERAGLVNADEETTANYVKSVFSEELKGHKVLTNRSLWRQFPAVHCERWHHENVVLIGDAAHTAHFSIGSGTKLVLEDAISLAQNLEGRWADVPAALASYEQDRRPRAERIQAAANISLTWFEEIEKHFNLPSLPFSFNLITRSRQISYDKMKLRDAAYVSKVVEHLSGIAGETREPLDIPISVGPHSLPRLLNLSETPPVGVIEISSGVGTSEAIALAKRARESGSALVHLIGTTDQSPFSLVDLAEELRVSAGLPVMVSGPLFSRDEMNTALAAGRVDLFGIG